jgi:tetratricopeptide (TPR) repeat protein
MFWAFRYGDRRAAFCIGLTILMFFPASNLVVLIGTIMGERLFYLPSVGLCLLAGIGYERALSRNEVRRHPRTSTLQPRTLLALRTLVVVVCLALSIRTIVRNLDWFSDQTLWQSAMQVVPQSAKVYHQIGTFALNDQRWSQANASFRAALRILPEYSLTESDLLAKIGVALLGEGDVEQAIGALERAASLERDSRLAHYNLGLAYARAARYEDAEQSYRRALALTSQAAEIYNSLSYVLTKQQRFEESEAMASEAIRLWPSFLEAHYNRGRALEALGRKGEAITQYERVLELSPTQDKVRNRLNRLRAQ